MKRIALILIMLVSTLGVFGQQANLSRFEYFARSKTVAFYLNLRDASVKGNVVTFSGLAGPYELIGEDAIVLDTNTSTISEFQADCLTMKFTVTSYRAVKGPEKEADKDPKPKEPKQAVKDTAVFLAITKVCKLKIGLQT